MLLDRALFGFRYSPEQLFDVVAAVDLYHGFVPWCQRSDIIRLNPDGSFDAELEIGFKFLVESYVSHVELERPKRIKVKIFNICLFFSWFLYYISFLHWLYLVFFCWLWKRKVSVSDLWL